jgi:2,5-diketo-D-gluconate reductase B
MHPHFHNRRVLYWCDRHGIAVTAYMPLGLGRALSDPAIVDTARRLNLAPAVVVLAWLIQQGDIVIPASTSRAHMAANLTAAEVTLDDDAMAALFGTDRHHRMINPPKSPVWD